MIEGIAGHAIELVADLLGYAELERSAKETEPVDLDLSLRRRLTGLESAIFATDAVVTGRNLPTVPGRAAELEHVLQNLVENRIKYRGEAAPRIRFDARRQGEMWIVRCRDNGRGIPKRFRDRVFEPFARGTSAVPGSGLGMAICQRIIEGHGGHIRVEASGVTGTTVAFSLPAPAG